MSAGWNSSSRQAHSSGKPSGAAAKVRNGGRRDAGEACGTTYRYFRIDQVPPCLFRIFQVGEGVMRESNLEDVFIELTGEKVMGD